MRSRKTTPAQYNKQDDDASVVSEAESVRLNLMALGIDLDESLIQRMQRNIGVSGTFNTVAKASTIVRNRAADKNLESQTRITEASKIIEESSPQKKQLVFQSDKYRGIALIRGLHNRESPLEPHVRAALEKLIQQLRILHGRNPERFTRCLFGRAKIKDKDEIGAVLLKTRYVDEDFFTEGFDRLKLQQSQSQISQFIEWIHEIKTFAGAKRKVVDLWLFFFNLEARGPIKKSVRFKNLSHRGRCRVLEPAEGRAAQRRFECGRPYASVRSVLLKGEGG